MRIIAGDWAEVEERFRRKVGPPTPTGCQEWQGHTDPSGYGRACVAGKNEQAHRVAWELDHGEPVPPGLLIRHICHNKSCVAPPHLRVGTHRDNSLDSIRAGRANTVRGTAHYNSQKTHCSRGHPYDAANTYRPPGGHRSRTCRTCVSASAKKCYQAKRYRTGGLPASQVHACYHPLGTSWPEFSGGWPPPIFGQKHLALATALIAKSVNPYPRD